MTGECDYCGHRVGLQRYTEQVETCVSLAGWLAETLLYPPLTRRHPDHELRTILAWAIEEDDFSAENTEEYRVFRRLMKERQTEDEHALLTTFREYEIQT